MNNLSKIKTLLCEQGPKKVLITTHTNPDGDAIGSILGLGNFLRQLGHDVFCAAPNNLPQFVNWLPNFERIATFEQKRDLCLHFLHDADLIFALDYNAPHRCEGLGPALADQKKAYKIMIDHHLNPDETFVHDRLWRTSASSASELVYEFIQSLESGIAPSLQALQALYVGILTDTGGFRHATSPQLFRTVSHMLEHGLDHNEISNLVFNSLEAKQFRVQNYCLAECLQWHFDERFALISVPFSLFKRFEIEKNDLEGLVNATLRVRSVQVAAMLTERENGEVKISMRSKGKLSVQAICMQHFQGGGHLNASGGASQSPLNEVQNKIQMLVGQALDAQS